MISDRLFELAEGQDGFFTTRQAARQGVSRHAILQAERRGHVERYQRGVYRLRNFPFNAGTAHYWEALLWPQTRAEVPAVLSHQTALRLRGLSDVNPDRVHITVPRRLRIQRVPPLWLAIHRWDLAPVDVEFVDGLPVTTIERTLSDIAQDRTTGPALLADAVSAAKQRGVTIPPHIEAQVK